MSPSEQPTAAGGSRGKVLLAFAAIYVIWGSTYLAIRVAIQTIPPFTMAGLRFISAGLILYGWQRARGAPPLEKNLWRQAVVLGLLMLAIGNGGVTFAEQKIPSGVTALLIASTPFWIALMDWLHIGGSRPAAGTLLGIAVGFCGVALLATAGREDAGTIHVPSLWALLASSLAWSAGSVYGRHLRPFPRPLLGIGAQMMAGGIFLLLFALMSGEPADLKLETVSAASLGAFLYLVIFGALIAFTAYSWLLKVTTAAKVATYAYVNPVIAVLLGASLGHEPLTPRILFGAAIILAGVGIISQQQRLPKARAWLSAAIRKGRSKLLQITGSF